jgi:glycosyltransferase involved in cell wall biosynthesis
LIDWNNIPILSKDEILALNPEEREKMGRAAKESVKRFDKETIMSQWKEVLTNTLLNQQ